MTSKTNIVTLPGVVSVHDVLDKLRATESDIECIVGVVIYKNSSYTDLFCSDVSSEKLGYCSAMMQAEVAKILLNEGN